MTMNSENESIIDKSDNRDVMQRFRSYGRESMEPFLGLLDKYGDTVGAYLEAMEEGLRSAGAILRNDSSNQSPVRRTVGLWFEEYSSWLGNMRSSFHGSDPRGVLSFIETEGKRQPAVLLASSILAGTLLGRLGRSAVQTLKDEKSNQANSQSEPLM